MGPLIIDTSLLVLLIVGTASRSYIRSHKSLTNFNDDDFSLLVEFIELGFSSIVVVPHILAETSNLASQIYSSAKHHIRETLAAFIVSNEERPIESAAAARHVSLARLGLTDAAILVACGRSDEGATLLTRDRGLAIEAEIAGVRVIHFDDLRL